MCLTPAGLKALDYVQDRLAGWSTSIHSALVPDRLETALELLRNVGGILERDKHQEETT